MYFLYVSQSSQKKLGNFFWGLPPEKKIVGVLDLPDFQEFGARTEFLEMTICFNEATRLLESTRSLVPSNF